ncbi:hypothetical protein SDJN03_21650, partial [Cucurbita argyrosperma subsp. sororia]
MNTTGPKSRHDTHLGPSHNMRINVAYLIKILPRTRHYPRNRCELGCIPTRRSAGQASSLASGVAIDRLGLCNKQPSSAMDFELRKCANISGGDKFLDGAFKDKLLSQRYLWLTSID